MTKMVLSTQIGDNNYRNDAVNKIRELAIQLGNQPIESPVGRQLEKVCRSVESCKSQHRMGFIAMLMAVAKNSSVGSTGRQRIEAAISALRNNGRCPKCNQRLVSRENISSDVSHATDDNCEQCRQSLPLPIRCISD